MELAAFTGTGDLGPALERSSQERKLVLGR